MLLDNCSWDQQLLLVENALISVLLFQNPKISASDITDKYKLATKNIKNRTYKRVKMTGEYSSEMSKQKVETLSNYI